MRTHPDSIVSPIACTLALMAALAVCSAAQAPTTIRINTRAGRHPISPLIYGVAYGKPDMLRDLHIPLTRMGGNNTTRYNWRLNCDNRGNDWFFESIGDESAVPGARGDDFVIGAKVGHAQAMLTIPTIDWIAKVGPKREKLASFSVAKYGPQARTDQWMPDAGNGVSKDTNKPITGNNPTDANVRNGVDVQHGWVKHLVDKFGGAAHGGLRYYILDNEPSIWHGTHRDVQPVGVTMDDVKRYMVDYARMIKASDPDALVVGPEEWGWTGYFYSGLDQQYGNAHGWANRGSLPDRKAHGGADYMPWLLGRLRAESQRDGKRLLDVFTLHIYPQGGEFGGDTSRAMQLKRNRSTRALWDPTYKDETWINDAVQLIPRMKRWVAENYPGTKTGITEYNWGADNHINGATAQADILGIFGREGLDMAARWVAPDPGTIVANVFRLYRNYDGRGGEFGDTSVAAAAPNPDRVAAFAAERTTDGALTVVAINKQLSAAAPVVLQLAGKTPRGAVERWQLTSANRVERLADLAARASSVSDTLPAQSITLYVVR